MENRETVIQLTRQELDAIVASAVAKAVPQALDSYTPSVHMCRFPISDLTAKKIPLLISMVESLGDQEGRDPLRQFERGAEVLTENAFWTMERRLVSEPDCTKNHELIKRIRAREAAGKMPIEEALNIVDEASANLTWTKRKARAAFIAFIVLGLLSLMLKGFYASLTQKPL